MEYQELNFYAVYAYLATIYGESLLAGIIFFTPLERIFGLRKDQKVFRSQLRADFFHFLLNGFLIHVGLIFCVVIIKAILQMTIDETAANGYPQLGQALQFTQATTSKLPPWGQILAALVISDLGFYTAHRLAHRVPWLWRFHSIHHSAENLDWLATYRFHPVDQIFLKIVPLVPLSILGVGAEFGFILALVNNHVDKFVHGNLNFRLGPLNYLFVTPEFHHWHHSVERAAFDKNFAGRFSLIDTIFGTAYRPKGKYADTFGITDPVPQTYIKQLIYPFQPQPESAVALFEPEAKLLGELGRSIKSQTGKSVGKAELIRTLIDAVEESQLDLKGATSEEDVKAIVAAKFKSKQFNAVDAQPAAPEIQNHY